MKKMSCIIAALAIGLTLTAGPLASQAGKKGKAAAKQVVESAVAAAYSCPMHPEVTSDKPGKCPKCGMFLEKTQAPAKATAAISYSCLMHPEMTSDKPGKCSKCDMNLIENGAQKAVQKGDAKSCAPAKSCCE